MKVKCILPFVHMLHSFNKGDIYEVIGGTIVAGGYNFDYPSLKHLFIETISIPCPHFGIGTSCYMSFPLKCKDKPCELYADQPPETIVCPTCKGVGRIAK